MNSKWIHGQIVNLKLIRWKIGNSWLFREKDGSEISIANSLWTHIVFQLNPNEVFYLIFTTEVLSLFKVKWRVHNPWTMFFVNKSSNYFSLSTMLIVNFIANGFYKSQRERNQKVYPQSCILFSTKQFRGGRNSTQINTSQ